MDFFHKIEIVTTPEIIKAIDTPLIARVVLSIGSPSMGSSFVLSMALRTKTNSGREDISVTARETGPSMIAQIVTSAANGAITASVNNMSPPDLILENISRVST